MTELEDMTREDFVAFLVGNGWNKKDAEREWERVQDDDESGYDGA